MKTLHLIMDPQCGWCYAAMPLINALTDIADINIKTYGGGLFSGAGKRPLSTEFYQQIIAMDKRIMDLTGQVFSATYYSQILEDEHRILDSDTPISAIIAAQSLGVDPLAMLHKMQVAQFVDGRSQSDIANLCDIAEQFGLSKAAFLDAFNAFSGDKTAKHIAQARDLLADVAGNGFPTFALQHSDGSYTKLDHSSYYGQPESWLAYVRQLTNNIQ